MLTLALRTVWNDINSKQRKGKSIVTYSIWSGDPIDPNNMGSDRVAMKGYIKTLLDNDVPVFVAVGNHSEK